MFQTQSSILVGNATATHRLMGSLELVCLIGGEAEIRCGNMTMSVHEGEVVILPDGVMQSITAGGDTDLHYIDVIQPHFSSAAEVSGDELAALPLVTDSVPIGIHDPREGIEWDLGSDMMIHMVANPVLMTGCNVPIEYSVAYAELLPGVCGL